MPAGGEADVLTDALLLILGPCLGRLHTMVTDVRYNRTSSYIDNVA